MPITHAPLGACANALGADFVDAAPRSVSIGRTSSAQLFDRIENDLLDVLAGLQVRHHEIVGNAVRAINRVPKEYRARLFAELGACCDYQRDLAASVVQALETEQMLRRYGRNPFTVRELAPQLRPLLRVGDTAGVRALMADAPDTVYGAGMLKELGPGQYRRLMRMVGRSS